MAPEEGRNVRNKLITITLAVIFMITILASSQLYRLPKYSGFTAVSLLYEGIVAVPAPANDFVEAL